MKPGWSGDFLLPSDNGKEVVYAVLGRVGGSAVVGGICTALVGEDAKTGGKSEEKKDGSLLSKIRRNHQVDSSADRLNNSFLLVRSRTGAVPRS